MGLDLYVQECILPAQRTLAVIYQDPYPFSYNVQRGLTEILNERFRGSCRDFMDIFMAPTTQVLKRLNAKGFPLTKEGKVIVHLFAPCNHLESGEMFYQVGHTTPGSLALKFTKYQGNDVIQQPSTVEEQDFRLAFTKAFIEKMRNKAIEMGDQLMRVLLTSEKNGHGDYSIRKVEVNNFMPESYTDGECRLSVMETGVPKCGDAFGNWPDQTLTEDEPGRGLGRHLQEDSNGLSCANSSNSSHLPLMQTVKSNQPAPAVGSYSTSNPNPAYPSMMQAVKDDKMTSVTGAQVQEQSFSKSGSNNPSYPPLMQAVNGNLSASSVTKNHTTCGDRSYSNPAYSPISHAVQDSPTAFGAPASQTREHLSTDNKKNPPYPATIKAVKLNTKFSGPDYQLENHPRTSSESSPAYPDLLQAAVRDDTIRNETASSESCRSAEHSLTGDTINPAYPPIQKAVNDEPLPLTSGYNSPNKTGSNPLYPALMTAVQDNIPSSNTASQSEECCAIGNSSNQPYPPLIQAVQSFPPTPSTDQQPRASLSGLSVNNLEYATNTQTSGSIPMSSTGSESDFSMLVDDIGLF